MVPHLANHIRSQLGHIVRAKEAPRSLVGFSEVVIVAGSSTVEVETERAVDNADGSVLDARKNGRAEDV